MVSALPLSAAGPHHQQPSREQPFIVLSQRGPLAFSVDAAGALQAQPGGGGLATALGALALQRPVRWVAAAMSAADRLAARSPEAPRFGAAEVRLVELPEAVRQQHYAAFANPLLWFVQHGLAGRLLHPRTNEAIARAWQEGYQPANALLAGHAAAAAEGNAPVILVQDYHLYLAPRLIRQRRPDARVTHFLHIPWPEPDAWETLPRPIVAGLLNGLLGADLLGFQSAADARRFGATCAAYLPHTTVAHDGAVVGEDYRRTLVRHYPITVDSRQLEQLAADPEAAAYRRAPAAAPAPGVQTILRVDRLDPSKNITAGFEAFGQLLAGAPELRGHVRFLAHLVPTRTELPEYQEAQREAFAAAAAVNARFGADGWLPVEIVYEENRARALVELGEYDVLLVNSLADGMNLVAKEGAVLNRRDGVLVLSRRTGAWEELGQWALGVDPADIAGTGLALHRALHMPAEERRQRAAGLRRAVGRTSLDRWLDDQLSDLSPGQQGVGRQLWAMNTGPRVGEPAAHVQPPDHAAGRPKQTSLPRRPEAAPVLGVAVGA